MEHHLTPKSDYEAHMGTSQYIQYSKTLAGIVNTCTGGRTDRLTGRRTVTAATIGNHLKPFKRSTKEIDFISTLAP